MPPCHLSPCPLAHGEDARSLLPRAMEESVELAVEGLGGCGAAPLAEGQDARGVVAHSMEQLKDAARTAFLAAAVGHHLLGSRHGAQQAKQEQEGTSSDLRTQHTGLAAFDWARMGRAGGTKEQPLLIRLRVQPGNAADTLQLSRVFG